MVFIVSNCLITVSNSGKFAKVFSISETLKFSDSVMSHA